MSDESNVIPITSEVKIPSQIKQTDLPELVQKQIVTLRRVTTCHNILTKGSFEYSSFDAVAASIHFLQTLYMEMANEIVKCPEAEGIADLQLLFERRREEEKKKSEIEGDSNGAPTKE